MAEGGNKQKKKALLINMRSILLDYVHLCDSFNKDRIIADKTDGLI